MIVRGLVASLCALVTIVSSAAAQGTEPLALVYAPTLGEPVTYVYTSEQSRVTAMGERTSMQSSSFQFTLRITPKASDDQGHTLELQLLRYTFTDEQTKGKAFDSDLPEADELAKALAPEVLPLLNKPLEMTVGLDGMVRMINGIDELPATKALPRIRSQILDPQAALRIFRPLFTTGAPEGKAAVGATWTSVDRNPAGPDLFSVSNNTHTFKELDNGRATIDIQAKVDWPLIPERNGVTVSAVHTTYSAVQVWDANAAALASFESRQRTVSNLTAPQGEMTQDTSAKVTLRRVEQPATP